MNWWRTDPHFANVSSHNPAQVQLLTEKIDQLNSRLDELEQQKKLK